MEKSMSTINVIDLEIDEKARSYAKIYSSLIKDEFQRKRAYASITALYAFSNLISQTKYNIQKAMTMFRNPELNEKYEISDIYINNWHIDVRVETDADAFIIPRIHEEFSIEPDFYAIVKVDSSLKTAKLLGFANPKTMKKEPLDYHYYVVSNTNIINYESFLNIVKYKKELDLKEEDHKFFLNNYLGVIDQEIDAISLKRILRHLFQCPKCRAEFCCFTGFEMVNCNLGKYPEILEDQTLNIIGAQAAESKEYEGKEETVYFDKDMDTEDNNGGHKEKDAKDNTKAENQTDIESSTDAPDNLKQEDSTVSEILDELFSLEEDTVPIHENTEIKEETNDNLTIIQEENKILDNTEKINMVGDQNLNYNQNTIKKDEKPQEIEEIQPTDNILEDSNEISLLDTDYEESDLDIIEDDNDNNIQEKPTMDKVIVDYDEEGEPVYSYITNISPENDSKSDFEEIDNIESTLPTMVLIDDIESVKTENITNNNLSDNNHLELIPEVNTQKEENIQEAEVTEDIEEIQDADEIEEIEEENEDYNSDLDDTKEIITPSRQTSDTETNEEYEEYEENDDNEYNSEDYEDEEDYEEDNDEEEIEDDMDEITNKKSSPKTAIFAGIFTVAIIAIAITTFGLIKKATNEETKVVTNKQEIEVPSKQETSNIFENVDDQDIFNELGGQNMPNITADEITNNESPTNTETTNNETSTPVAAGTAETPQTPGTTENNAPKELTENDLVAKQPNNDLNKSMTDAFSDQSQFVTSVKGINWMCLPSLFNDQEFKSYLQKLDKALKLNLNSNLLNSSSSPINNSITYKMAIDNEGNLLKIQSASSTGSDELDNIVLQSIKETLALQKTQIISNSQQKADKYLLQVVIKL